MKPTLGRILHVRFPIGGATSAIWLAAIVTTEVWAEIVDESPVEFFKVAAFYPIGGVPAVGSFKVEDEGTSWRWPPRDS